MSRKIAFQLDFCSHHSAQHGLRQLPPTARNHPWIQSLQRSLHIRRSERETKIPLKERKEKKRKRTQLIRQDKGRINKLKTEDWGRKKKGEKREKPRNLVITREIAKWATFATTLDELRSSSLTLRRKKI